MVKFKGQVRTSNRSSPRVSESTGHLQEKQINCGLEISAMECETTGDVGSARTTGKNKNGNSHQKLGAISHNCGNSRCNQNGVVQPLLTGRFMFK